MLRVPDAKVITNGIKLDCPKRCLTAPNVIHPVILRVLVCVLNFSNMLQTTIGNAPSAKAVQNVMTIQMKKKCYFAISVTEGRH